MIGRNVIGRIYRPKNIRNFLNGFSIETKIKSNFGGFRPLNINLYCKENTIFLNMNEVAIFENNRQFLKGTEEFKLINIETNRLIKPDYLYSKLTGNKISKNKEKGVVIPISFFNQSKKIDTVMLSFYTTIIDNNEYIAFKLD